MCRAHRADRGHVLGDVRFHSAGPAPTTVPAWCRPRSRRCRPPAVPTSPTTGAQPTTVVAVPANIPPATQQPTGLGTDATLDAMAQSCFAGDMSACDNLFFAAPVNSAYEAYGDTCAGRQPPFSGLCVDAFGPAGDGPGHHGAGGHHHHGAGRHRRAAHHRAGGHGDRRRRSCRPPRSCPASSRRRHCSRSVSATTPR